MSYSNIIDEAAHEEIALEMWIHVFKAHVTMPRMPERDPLSHVTIAADIADKAESQLRARIGKMRVDA